jgi:hypothetical protein
MGIPFPLLVLSNLGLCDLNAPFVRALVVQADHHIQKYRETSNALENNSLRTPVMHDPKAAFAGSWSPSEMSWLTA